MTDAQDPRHEDTSKQRRRTEEAVRWFWQALVEFDEYTALQVTRQCLEDGMSPEGFLMEVVAPAQYRIGEHWADNRLTPVQEHGATAISERAVAMLAARARDRHQPPLGHLTVACTEDEWHAMPARLVAQVLTLHGWHVTFLGAHVPTAHLVSHVRTTGPDAVALSCSLSVRLPGAHAAISACQSAGVPVAAGGRGFGPDGRYARILGADVWAPTATRLIEELALHGVPPRRDGAPRPLPHLSDQEYALLTRNKSPLVTHVLHRLPAVFPDMAAYTSEQLRYTDEDVNHILDFLAAALYVDDATLFTEFLVWTAAILEARSVPAHSVVLALDLAADRLHDFPRALRLIAAGREALRARSSGAGPAEPDTGDGG